MGDAMLGSTIVLCIGVLGGLLALIVRHDINSRLNAMAFELDKVVAENSSLMRQCFELKTHINEVTEIITLVGEEDYTYEVNEPTEFEKRIERFKEDLNTPTYPENVAVADKGTYNLSHDVITDVPLRAEEEYAR